MCLTTHMPVSLASSSAAVPSDSTHGARSGGSFVHMYLATNSKVDLGRNKYACEIVLLETIAHNMSRKGRSFLE